MEDNEFVTREDILYLFHFSFFFFFFYSSCIFVIFDFDTSRDLFFLK